ncbi:MAG: hydrogenase iron-sulfur subunit [Candidatus Thorarchaeota archaeon]
MKLGVFLCNCASSIDNINWGELMRFASRQADYVELCNDICTNDGIPKFMRSIVAQDLDRIVFAGCSPKYIAPVLRPSMKKLGRNKFVVANIREQCAWVHDGEACTRKAKAILNYAITKARSLKDIRSYSIPIRQNAVVIGGGTAGMHVTQDLMQMGIHVDLIEKEPILGGLAAKLAYFYPTNDCAQCLATPGEVGLTSSNLRHCIYRWGFTRDPRLDMHTNCQVIDIRGSVGNFEIDIEKTPTFVDPLKCTMCGMCEEACPIEVPNERDFGLSTRKAIHLPFQMAIPQTYVVDKAACAEGCEKCAEVCKVNAIDLSQKPAIETIQAGAIALTTGFEEMDASEITEYNYGQPGFENVLTQTQLARILDISGPTEGELLRPSDKTVPQKIVIINCAGSRSKKYYQQCCNVGCMVSLKHAVRIKEKFPETDVTICYIDMRVVGNGYEQYYDYARDLGVKFIRGRPGSIEATGNGILIVNTEDTLEKELKALEADLVVLTVAMLPSKGTSEIAKMADLELNPYGHYKNLYVKIRPFNTKQAGIYLAGASIAPMDVPSTVAYASGAASRIAGVLSRSGVTKQFPIAKIDLEVCSRCQTCVTVCPYGAISLVSDEGDGGAMHPQVDATRCYGCCTCVGSCPTEAIQLDFFEDPPHDEAAVIRAMLYDADQSEKPLIAVFSCFECGYAAIDTAGHLRMKYPENLRVIEVKCGAHMSARRIFNAFEAGAEGVLLVGCQEGKCHFEKGHETMRNRVAVMRDLMEASGMDQNRLEVEYAIAADADRFVEAAKRIVAAVEKGN